MKFSAVWTTIVHVFDAVTFSSFSSGDRQDVAQIPLVKPPTGSRPTPGPVRAPYIPITQDAAGSFYRGDARLVQDPSSAEVYDPNDPILNPLRTGGDELAYLSRSGEPNFPFPTVPTPKNPQEGVGGGLDCKYPAMEGWESCYGPDNRACWLKKGGEYIDINTDYEDPDKVPVGITRRFYLDVSEQPISPDGMTMEHGKVFNRRYPGPWIEACWGDFIEVTVRNNLRWNGTSVHWHGIRQFESFQHDGVNGITECPIAPGETFTYKFRALQYGSAWYHSHYSLQYGDGLLGPLTIYGPSTANFSSDQAFRPLLLTDWNHRSVFEDWPIMLNSKSAPEMTNILFNGTGQFGFGPKPTKYTLGLLPGQAHMMILVNTAVDTTFVFAIDNHLLEVIEMDFVPIKPYNTTNLKIGIGQRYHVLVHGLTDPYKAERYGNYWMRAIPARKCSKFAFGPDEQMGIIRYNKSDPVLRDPLSDPELYDTGCADEPYGNLKPWIPWQVGDPVNIDPTVNPDDLPNDKKFIFNVGMTPSGGPNTSTPYIPNDKAYNRWDMHIAPFRVNFSDPTLLALDRLPDLVAQPHLDVMTLDDSDHEKWVWMVITAPERLPSNAHRLFVPGAHPMHLHGHDFALLRQSSDNWYPDGQDEGDYKYYLPDKLNCRNENITCDNPPRRDVVLLPAAGYVIIAFKADNPGAWIFHCHIAFHASSGLAMQIIENKDRIPEIIADDKDEIEKACKTWNDWYSNPYNLWDWNHPEHFQDDSGV